MKKLEYNAQEIEKAIIDPKHGLRYSKREINREYLIKVTGCGYNTLVGVRGIVALIGCERVNKIIDRAAKCLGDVQRCKVYGTGMQVSLYIN